MRIIITGATGMVGEGVLLHCLQREEISEVLMINRRPFSLSHPKLKELVVSNFNQLEDHKQNLSNYDGCFYCAGVSSIGKNEADYTRITFDTTINFAKVLAGINPDMVFNFVTGAQTDTNGAQMWQKVKGRTEDTLIALGFRGQYNFRPGFMKPVAGQKNVRWFFKPIIAILPYLIPKQTLLLSEVGQAMIHTITKGYSKQRLEISDIKALSK
ncbi:MAG: NAD-dependent epimerase/dehydratase family protein [Chitinophagaceae bacterium]|nr:MAG: NAD-dependent epimerase/dehydratase family protein [Chitinophagaceae bacterium]